MDFPNHCHVPCSGLVIIVESVLDSRHYCTLCSVFITTRVRPFLGFHHSCGPCIVRSGPKWGECDNLETQCNFHAYPIEISNSVSY